MTLQRLQMARGCLQIIFELFLKKASKFFLYYINMNAALHQYVKYPWIKHVTLHFQYKHANVQPLLRHWQVYGMDQKASDLVACVMRVESSAHPRRQACSKTVLLLLLDFSFPLNIILWPFLPNYHFHVLDCGKLAFHNRPWKLSLIRAGAEKEDCLL